MSHPRLIDITAVEFPPKPTHPRFRDIEGQTFGRLQTVGFLGIRGFETLWACRCVCGNHTAASTSNLRSGHTRSCGCYAKEQIKATKLIHGHNRKNATTPEYRSFHHARERCRNPQVRNFDAYGGRGIEFRFASFQEFVDVLGRKPSSKHSLDRIDNNGHYEPGNVRWATKSEQANNTRVNHKITVRGQEHTVREWERLKGFVPGTIWARLHRGNYCEKCAVDCPARQSCPHIRNVRQDVESALVKAAGLGLLAASGGAFVAAMVWG